jgi:hypothetical protein
VVRRVRCLFIVLAFLHGGVIGAQQSAQPPPVRDESTSAKIECRAESYVSLTADSEQTLPLQLVEKLKCDEGVTVLSDLEAYTIKVRTGDGKVGYVSRYEIAISPHKADSATAVHAGPAGANSSRGSVQALSSAKSDSDTQAKDPFKPRVYVSDTQSWIASGGFSGVDTTAGEKLYGGYNPELPDIFQDFTSSCSSIIVTQEAPKADYAVLFDREAGSILGGLVKRSKIAVLSKTGETIFSESAHSPDTAVKDACAAIQQKSGGNSVARINP